jgi:hypothetical protein
MNSLSALRRILSPRSHAACRPRTAGVEFAFDWIEHAAEWSAERMADYQVVLLTKANNVSAID